MKKQNVKKTIFMLMVISVMFWKNGYGATYHWVGGDITKPFDWNTAANWLELSVPTATDDVIFGSDGNVDCIVISDVYVHNIYISANYWLEFKINAGINIYISGNLTTEDNIFLAVWTNYGNIILTGSDPQSITIESPDLWTFENLTINKTDGDVILGNDIYINIEHGFDNISGSNIQYNGHIIYENGNPLPIELLSFTAFVEDNQVKLCWATASEENNDYFIIEKSGDCSIWSELIRVDGAGNSATQIDYSTIDPQPLIGTSYYRLTQVDYDGKSETFETRSILFTDDNRIVIYPNPASEYIVILFSGANITIIDQFGKIVMIAKEGENNISHLANGNYYVINNTMTYKFVKY